MPEEDAKDRPTTRKPNICLVDDDDLMLSLFARIIKRCGCDVVSAKGPEPAIALLASTQVDMVISDLRMPEDSDGENLLSLLYATYPQIPITMMSADFTDVARQRLMSAGAIECIAKPLTVESVTVLIDTLDNPELCREAAAPKST